MIRIAITNGGDVALFDEADERFDLSPAMARRTADDLAICAQPRRRREGDKVALRISARDNRLIEFEGSLADARLMVIQLRGAATAAERQAGAGHA